MSRPDCDGVGFGGSDVLWRRVDAADGKAQPRHRFGQKAAAASDVQQRQPLEWLQAFGVTPEMRRNGVADEGKTDRVELVQRRELARGVPPFVGHRRELGDFGFIYCCVTHFRFRVERGSTAVYVCLQHACGKRNRLMAKIAMKFGGTSVADLDRIRHVASSGEARTSTAATRSRWWFRPWRARPTSWSAGPTRSPRCRDQRSGDA